MGTGTDVAMASGKVTLVKGDLGGIARARELSEATVANKKQNPGFALVYNMLGVPVAAGVRYRVLWISSSPLTAGAGHAEGRGRGWEAGWERAWVGGVVVCAGCRLRLTDTTGGSSSAATSLAFV